MSIAEVSQEAGQMELALRYEGEALAEGRMSARELGPAIFAMGELLERTSELLYKGEVPLRVDVEGSMKRGSFIINFVAAGEPAGLLSKVTLEQIKLIGEIIGLAGTGAFGVFAFIRAQMGKKVEAVEPEDDDHVTVTFVAGDQVTVHNSVYLVASDPRVRRAIEGVTDPLRLPGVDALEIGVAGAGRERIEAGEVKYFAASLAPQNEQPPEVVTAFLEIVSPSFREGNKWQFDAAGMTFYAAIEDAAFLDRVRRKDEKFSSGDVLRVRMRIVQRFMGDRAVKTERAILQVINHFQAEEVEQLDLGQQQSGPPAKHDQA